MVKYIGRMYGIKLNSNADGEVYLDDGARIYFDSNPLSYVDSANEMVSEISSMLHQKETSSYIFLIDDYPKELLSIIDSKIEEEERLN